MVRLRNTASGAIVSVADEKVARLGDEWVPVEETSPAPRKPGRRRKINPAPGMSEEHVGRVESD
jgi:hypothetical protein